MKKVQALTLILLLAAALFSAVPVRAQMCDTLFEVIMTLRPPMFGFPTVWDAKYGKNDKMTQIASGVTMEGGTVFTFGRTLNKDTFKPEQIVLAEINRRGRALKEQAYPAADGEEPVKMIRVGNQFVALSTVHGGGNGQRKARLSWYDLEGKYKREKILYDNIFDYEGIGLVPAAESSGFVAILRAVNRGDASDQNGVLIRFAPDGGQVWRRVYRPGIPNVIHSLVAIDNTTYIAAGRIRLEDGRMAGWAMKLGFDGAVHWQRTYPRGKFSVFRHAALSGSETAEGAGFILAGDSEPYDGTPRAAWIMAIDALGEPLWQRYFRREDYELSGNWIVREPDGRLIAIMNAAAVPGAGGQGHVRMLTMSPRGVVIQDEGYYEGLQARATDYVPGWNGERVLTAIIEDDIGAVEEDKPPIVVVGLLPEEEAAGETEEPPQPEKPVDKGWVFIATALDPYNDVCAVKR